jgi:hypothetical protein
MIFIIKNKKIMKRIVRLTESDLTRIVRRVISEQEEAFIEQIDSELDSVPEEGEDPGLLERIINKIQDAGHDVEMVIRRLKRNGRKFRKHISRHFQQEMRQGKKMWRRIKKGLNRMF